MIIKTILNELLISIGLVLGLGRIYRSILGILGFIEFLIIRKYYNKVFFEFLEKLETKLDYVFFIDLGDILYFN